MLKRLTCFVSGQHIYRMRERDGRIFLECQQCGGQSPGWESPRRVRDAAPGVRLHSRARDTETIRAVSTPDDGHGRVNADEFLRDVLANGPMKQADVTTAARARGIADRTLRRARSRLGAVATKQGFGRGSFWLWRLAPTRHTDTTLPSRRNTPPDRSQLTGD